MEPERWRLVESVFDRVLDGGAADRERLLEELCAGDAELRREVESLLAEHEPEEEFLETPAFALPAADAPAVAETVAIAAGAQIGQYRLVREIGIGGTGIVYEAVELNPDQKAWRSVALKFLAAELAGDRHWTQRFQAEARAMSVLDHPNICTVYEVKDVGGRLFLAMELLEGQTLKETIDEGAIPVGVAVGYGVQMAHALEAAHAKGIVHRDIKPHNVFVTRRGEVKILDFGIAKVSSLHKDKTGAIKLRLASRTRTGTVLGTSGYMSPEQVRGEAIDHRSDIFSFGATLYEMLTKRRAFAHRTMLATMAAIVNEAPAPMGADGARVPAALQRIVARCVEKEPGRRFQSAAELGMALEAVSKGNDVGRGVWGRFLRWK